MWKPAFEHRERSPAWIEGWSRRFWQGSTDHRGLPGAPGRVVTLHPEPGARCWGMAYAVAPEDRVAVLSGLDFRERGGYERSRQRLHLVSKVGAPRIVSGLVYYASPENPNYLGPASLDVIARQVRRSRGPSGLNREYVARLAESLREMGAEDRHVFELEAQLCALEDSEREPTRAGGRRR